MAGTSGHFLLGLASSIQGMPQRLYEMKWKKKQEKKLQAKQDELMESVSLYNKTVDELDDDGWFSKDDYLKLSTIAIAGGTEFQEIIKTTHNHIKGLYESQVEQDFELIDSFIEMSKDMDLKNLDESLEIVRGFVKSEGALNKLAAYENILKKKPEDIWGQAGKLPMDIRPEYLRAKGVEIPKAEVTPKAPSVAQQKYDWATEAYLKWLIDPKDPEGINFEEYKKYMGVSVTPEKSTGLEKQIQDIRTEGERAGIDPAKINKAIQDKILGKPAGALTPTAPAVENVREDIKNAPTLEDAKRIEKNHIAKYGDTLEIPNVDKFWSDERVRRLNTLKQGIDKLLDEKKRLKKGSITSAEVGFEIEDDIQKVEAVYQQLREEYMKYRSMLKKMGVDVNQFPELMSYDEYIKTDIKPKIIYDPRTWGGQKPAIY